MDKISLLVPTRGRPTQLLSMWNSAREMAANPELLELSLYIDSDDELTINAVRQFPGYSKPYNVKCTIGRRIFLSEMTNRAAKLATGNIFWCGGDDNLFRTQDWDTKVREGFDVYPDKIALVGGCDGYNTSLFSHPFIHRNWYKIVGQIFEPNYSSDYGDTTLWEMAKIVDRRLFIDILIEHFHYSSGKGVRDKTMQEKEERLKAQRPDLLFLQNAHKRMADSLKLANFIKDFNK